MALVNSDLLRERSNCSFSVRELTEFLDGGPDKTLQRKKVEKAVLAIRSELGDDCQEYLSYKDSYEDSVRKNVFFFKVFRQMQNDGHLTLFNYNKILTDMLCQTVLRNGAPMILHYIMFMPVFLSQANEEQQKKWLGRAWNCEIIGSYAQTELGHGTFIRGLETTATYDADTKEFVLHSPTLTSYKWWSGGLGQTSNYCIVIAQLYTKGQNYGIHSFIVQVRDEETHRPLPGMKVGEIGAKMGMNNVNNGFIGFDNVRIPRDHMLMKYAQVLEDGTYVKSDNSKLIYGGMVFVRVFIVFDQFLYLSRSVTIAIRYSAVRRQCQLQEGKEECQILDYMTQQHKLFIAVAQCFALKFIAQWLWKMYTDINEEFANGQLERLAEIHALACCLKSVSTSDTAKFVERCRLACGGYGFMISSNMPELNVLVTASCTYEGDNTVLLLQTARFLVKSWRSMDSHGLLSTVQYLKTVSQKGFPDMWTNNVEGIIIGFQLIAMKKVKLCSDKMEQRVLSGLSFADAWDSTSIQLVAAAEAHCRVINLTVFHEEISKKVPSVSPELGAVLKQLVELYAIYWTMEKLEDFLLYTAMSKDDVEILQRHYEDLLIKIRPNIVGLVDGFDIMDEVLQSTIGSYDGRIYERLMEEALKSPLNAEPVNSACHQYLKTLPFVPAKI